ncbi:MAG TPA: hypothetical protein VNZ56_15760 [Verrucomicrobiae bacterium]|jgi:hypothetical protein|nr:hypothetical protein [Verrucomicrobiae bacterium]
MALTQPEIRLLLHGTDDPPKEDIADDNTFERIFEDAKLRAALGTDAAKTAHLGRAASGRASASPDWDDEVTDAHVLRKQARTAENLVRKNHDGSYVLRSENGKMHLTFSPDGELISGIVVNP